MLKELLILILFIQISHAQNITREICDQDNHNPDWADWSESSCLELPRCLNLSNSYETCKNCGGKILGHDNVIMICVPNYFKESLSYPPYSRVPMKDGKWNAPLTDINIRMGNVQVISIGTHAVTISMNLEVNWSDYRLKLWNYPPKEYWTWTFLGNDKEFENLIWFPDIDINNMVSLEEKSEKVSLLRMNNKPIPLVTRTIYLSTTINCEMNFQLFPFDKHDCNLEVQFFYACSMSVYVLLV